MNIFGRKKPLTTKQRRKKLAMLREESSLLAEEAKVTKQVQAERKEIKRLQGEVHPSKVKRLAHLLGKAEHGGISVGRAFIRVHKELGKADEKFQKAKKKSPKGFLKYK